MAYLVNDDELDKVGKDLRDYSNNVVKTKINELMTLKNEMRWSGNAKDTYFKRYDETLKIVSKLGDKMELLGFYLQYVSKCYRECREQSNKEFLNYLEEMKARKKKDESEIIDE